MSSLHMTGLRSPKILVGGWALAAGLLYAALFLTAILLAPSAPSSYSVCFFHALTGHPCPTCGATRCWLALAQGDWLAAWWHNPLWLVLTLAAGPALVCWLYARRRARRLLPQSRLWRWVLGAVLAILFLANWAYLWISGQ